MATTHTPTRDQRAPARPRSVQDGFVVTTIESAAGPDDDRSEGWYRYVLEAMGSTITGCRRGSLREVTRYAKQFARQLNDRYRSNASSPWMRKQR
ncbi:MAG TPA: hypothetical protein VKA14_08805 [Gammaproteobacteria bacterium]|nr:hypothetical protein [Gammaproteobacteria bacterium]